MRLPYDLENFVQVSSRNHRLGGTPAMNLPAKFEGQALR
jgi:hypothetical protein